MRSLVSHPVICRSAQKTLSAKSMQTVALQDDVYALQQPGDLSETFDFEHEHDGAFARTLSCVALFVSRGLGGFGTPADRDVPSPMIWRG
jgi:hypothetical protein